MSNPSEVIHGHALPCQLNDDGRFPNNSRFPLLVYKGVLHLHPGDDADCIAAVFRQNNWTNSWTAGIFDYHHYHSNTHEVLGVFTGTADVQFGGDEGICVELTRGDAVVIPAGVAHKCLRSSEDFVCVGAYPDGKEYDMNYGHEGERPAADERIAGINAPENDPVFGKDGSLNTLWKN
jgi:uncharacterized protein YjlB